MRLGIDLHVADGMHQGSRRYLEGLYRAALALPSRHEWVFFLGDVANRPQGWPDTAEFRSFGTHASMVRLAGRADACARRERVQCMHYQYVAPFFSRCETAVTVHDILYESYPHLFPWSARWLLGPLIRRTVERARLVFTVSEFSRQELINRYRVPEERLVMTPNGVDRTLFHPGGREASALALAAKYGVKDFILTVGRLEPRKNHAALVEAYRRLKDRGRDLPQLVFLGAEDFGTQSVRQSIVKAGLERDVRFLSRIGDGELADFYRAALVMAYPSFAEGFGLPPLEAMACGCPVIASGTTALAEVVAGCGWSIDPEDPDTLAEALEEAISQSAKAETHRQAGLQRASHYTWENSARALLSGFDRLEGS